MKKSNLIAWAGCALVALAGCAEKETTEVAETTSHYYLTVENSGLSHAPALQSFIHGVSGDQWLLFGGRTNAQNDDGGLHDFGNYSSEGFPIVSFNTQLYVYNPTTDAAIAVSFTEVDAAVKAMFGIDLPLTTFINSNPQVTQEGDYLYYFGGYGPTAATYEFATGEDVGTGATYEYITYSQMVRVHVPGMISLVQALATGQTPEAGSYPDLIYFGDANTLEMTTTGGEVFLIGDTFYMSGGHDFQETVVMGTKNPATSYQRYQNAVYPFTLSYDQTNYSITATLQPAISDYPNLIADSSRVDSLSKFRRRDGPMVPSLFAESAGGAISEGLSLYAGVFQFHFAAWNTAIYIHPSWAGTGQGYTYDGSYNQNNQNVYACADIVGYDNSDSTQYTFLPGGIGDGGFGFTNNGLTISRKVHEMSSQVDSSYNLFGTDTTAIYGAEAEVIFNSTAQFVQGTEVLDLSATMQNAGEQGQLIGWIYGGIQATGHNPGGHGPGLSQASNIIWKVYLNQ